MDLTRSKRSKNVVVWDKVPLQTEEGFKAFRYSPPPQSDPTGLIAGLEAWRGTKADRRDPLYPETPGYEARLTEPHIIWDK